MIEWGKIGKKIWRNSICEQLSAQNYSQFQKLLKYWKISVISVTEYFEAKNIKLREIIIQRCSEILSNLKRTCTRYVILYLHKNTYYSLHKIFTILIVNNHNHLKNALLALWLGVRHPSNLAKLKNLLGTLRNQHNKASMDEANTEQTAEELLDRISGN